MIQRNIALNAAAALFAVFLSGTTCAADQSAVLIQGPKVSVTSADLAAEIDRIPEQDRADYFLDVKRVNSTLEQIYLTKELARQAVELKLNEDPFVKDKLENAREKVLSQEQIAHFQKTMKMPDFSGRARELYLTEKEKYRIEPMAKASHVLISWKEISKEAALKKAQEVRARIASGQETIEAVAGEVSDDPSAKANKGALGWFDAKKVAKPFADVVFAMKPGELSQPIETRFGYHIIRLDDRKEGGYKTFDEVKPHLIEQLKAEYLKAERTRMLSEIKGDKRIVVNTAEIVKLNPKANLAPDTTIPQSATKP